MQRRYISYSILIFICMYYTLSTLGSVGKMQDCRSTGMHMGIMREMKLQKYVCGSAGKMREKVREFNMKLKTENFACDSS